MTIPVASDVLDTAVRDDLDVAKVRAMAEEIATTIPSRLAGSAQERRVAQYTRDALRDAGLSATIHEIPGLVSFPERGPLTLLGAVPEELDAITFGHSPEIAPFEADLVYVGAGGEADYDGRDVAGRIALMELSLAPVRHDKQRIAARRGARAAIMINGGRDEDDLVPYGSIKAAWGTPTPDTPASEMPVLPVVGVGRKTGLRLRGLCQAGPVRVRLAAVAETGWRKLHLTEAVVAGAEPDFVLLAGHQDGWYGEAATDNAPGNAVMLELARVFQKHRHRLRRGIRICFWTGHETGTMVGSTWYLDRHWDAIRQHATGYVLIDQVAGRDMTRWGTTSSIEFRDFHRKIETALLGDREITWGMQKKLGDCSFFGAGIPMIFAMGRLPLDVEARMNGANWGWWHHSAASTLDKVDFEDLPDHLRVYAAYLWQLCTMAVLPYRFAGSASAIRDRLAALAALAGDLELGPTLALSERLVQAAGRFDAVAEAWSVQPEDVAEPVAGALNETMKRLCHRLIPIMQTVSGVYGQDTYGMPAQANLLPALHEVTRYAALPEGPEKWMLAPQLQRARNWITDMLQEALALLESSPPTMPSGVRT